MNRIEWSDDFSVGVDKFDEQHKKLFSIVNRYCSAVEKDEGANQLKDLLETLWWYTVNHFREEEEEMGRAGYEGLESHRKEHQALMADVRKYNDAYRQGKEVNAEELITFLNEWLRHHIAEIDIDYAPVIRNHLEGQK